jgi:hypothetical protein
MMMLMMMMTTTTTTNQPVNVMPKAYSWEVDGYSASKEILYFYEIRRTVGFAQLV